MPGLHKRSFRLVGHRTSVALEPEFWAALETLAAARGLAVGAIVTEIDAARVPGEALASLVRLTILRSLILTVQQL